MLVENSLNSTPVIANSAPTLVLDSLVVDGGFRTRIPRTGYVYDVRMMGHAECLDPDEMETDDDKHPEQPGRIEAIDKRLDEGGCKQLMKVIPIRPMRQAEANLVHSEDHWKKVAVIACEQTVICDLPRLMIKPILGAALIVVMNAETIANSRKYYEHLSLYVHPNTPEAALLSGGGVIEATLAVARHQVKTSFANVRPPGHHAEPEEHMGFCFFNNVAIAAKVAQLETDVKKIMILDWSVLTGA